MLDEAIVEHLVREQHPELAGPVRLVASGWDNALYRLGADLAVRLPLREEAVPLVENELQWLPTLAALVPVPVPVPIAAGRPGAGYPWPWSICRWCTGRIAAECDLRGLGPQLARILRALHVPAPPEAPRNRVRGVPLHDRDQAVRERLTAHYPALLPQWERALAAPLWDGPPLWLHGDLHPANVLVHDGAISALIDFGDLCAGDPAVDLAAGWLFFDETDRLAFDVAYGIDDATRSRARGWAISLATVFVVRSPAGSPLIPVGERVIQQLG